MNFRNATLSIFWGVITAGMSLIFQLIVISLFLPQENLSEIDKDFLSSVIFLALYALSEESFKYFIVIKKIIPLSYGRSFMTNAWLAGIGFSLVEAFIIYQKNISEKINFSPIDLFSTTPLHILTFGTLGYFLATTDKKGINLNILILNFIAHFIYNYSIIYWDSYGFIARHFIITIFLVINLYGLIIINKKLASD